MQTAWWAPLNRAWRLVGTGLSFAIFGLGGLILGGLVFPILGLVIRDSRRRRQLTRRLIQLAMRGFVETMRFVGVLRYRVTGTEHIQGLTRHIIVANHPALIDVVFLMAWFPQVECVIKSALFANPFTGATLRAADYIPNDDPVVVMQSCVERVRDGGNLIVFPEGTRTVPGKPMRFKRGPAVIGIRAGARFLPVRIRCQPTTLTKAEPWYHIPPQRVMFEVAILPSLDPFEGELAGADERVESTRMTEMLRELLDEPVQRG